MDGLNQVQLKNMEDFCRPTFAKISFHKKEKILLEAQKEFAKNGYISANINRIAKNASISIGSMYSYFDSKEKLFLGVLQIGINTLEIALNTIDIEKNEFYDIVRDLLKIAREYATNYKEMNQIYMDLSSQVLEDMLIASRVSYDIEHLTKDIYKKIIKKGKKDGVVSKSIDSDILSFYLDNIITTYQFSFTSTYWKNRLCILLKDKSENYEEIEEELITIIREGVQKGNGKDKQQE